MLRMMPVQIIALLLSADEKNNNKHFLFISTVGRNSPFWDAIRSITKPVSVTPRGCGSE